MSPSPDWLSWELWVATAHAVLSEIGHAVVWIWAGYVANRENVVSLATLIAGVIGIPLLAIRTLAANRSARAALEQAKTAAERHDEQMRADRERRITESFTAGRYVFYAWPRQVADFYDMRVRKNFEFGQRFAGVGGMADLVGLHREYVRDTFLDYASSVYEMAGIWDRIIDEFTREKSPLHAHLEDLEAELAASAALTAGRNMSQKTHVYETHLL